MAFDLYLGKERAFIDIHEEVLFSLINENDQFPNLNWLWQNYYESPLISPERANDIIHELIKLLDEINNKSQYKQVKNTIDRILPFISKAYKENTQIECSSD